MTIDEAQKLLSELQGLLPEVGFNKYIASVRLGIEALKRIEGIRTYDGDYVYLKLPGEIENERSSGEALHHM